MEQLDSERNKRITSRASIAKTTYLTGPSIPVVTLEKCTTTHIVYWAPAGDRHAMVQDEPGSFHSRLQAACAAQLVDNTVYR